MERNRLPDEHDGWYIITPVIAGELLSNQPQNRHLRERKANRFAEEIKAGRWRSNGQPIILDKEGRLMDGQGRCRACQIAGKSIEVYVVHNIPRQFFPSLDITQTRSATDTLSLLGAKNYAIAASVSRMSIVYEKGGTLILGQYISNEETKSYWDKHSDDIESAIRFIFPYMRMCPVNPSLMAFVYYKTLKINEEKAREFTIGVMTGVGLEKSSPQLVFRNRITSSALASRLSVVEKRAFAIKAWNAFITNTPISILKWNKKSPGKAKSEPFPRFLNYEGEEM